MKGWSFKDLNFQTSSFFLFFKMNLMQLYTTLVRETATHRRAQIESFYRHTVLQIHRGFSACSWTLLKHKQASDT